MILKIDVTEDDIRRGDPGSVGSCPIARAVHRQFPAPGWAIRADGSTILAIPRSGDTLRFATTRVARDFMHRFDTQFRGSVPKPRSFTFREVKS